jgi:sirohydrochlorin ferrochelatase
MQTGIVIVDHGSRRAESNRLLEEVARLFAERFRSRYGIVEPAHMELCEPSIATAFARCVERGATHVVVCPFFLGPGKHWTKDIPTLTAQAAANHPGSTYHVTMPLGVDDLILDLLDKRITHCTTQAYRCPTCTGTIRSGEPGIPLPESAAHSEAPSINEVQCSGCPFITHEDGTIEDRRAAASTRR